MPQRRALELGVNLGVNLNLGAECKPGCKLGGAGRCPGCSLHLGLHLVLERLLVADAVKACPGARCKLGCKLGCKPGCKPGGSADVQSLRCWVKGIYVSLLAESHLLFGYRRHAKPAGVARAKTTSRVLAMSRSVWSLDWLPHCHAPNPPLSLRRRRRGVLLTLGC